MSNVRIDQTDKEYILKIPYSEKDRAKAIKGYRWDNNQKSWIYPRTLRNFQALIAEFGDDLVTLEITPPEIAKSSISPEKSSKEEDIQKEFATIRKQLELLLESKQLSESELGNMIKELSLEKEELTKALLVKDQETFQLKIEKEKLEKEIDKRKEVKLTHDFFHHIKKIVKRSAEKNKRFNSFIDEISIDTIAANQASNFLEDTLRSLLKEKDKKLSLHELIMMAKDADILSPEGANLAHIIRSQRNIITHEKVDIKTQLPRILLILFAAAVLWPLLPE